MHQDTLSDTILTMSTSIASTKTTIRTGPMDLRVGRSIRAYDTGLPYSKMLFAESTRLGGYSAACLNERCQARQVVREFSYDWAVVSVRLPV